MDPTEKAVRDAAAALASAIADARKEGFHIQWPQKPEGLATIVISETKKPAVTVSVKAPAGISAEIAAKADVAAQQAAEKVIENGE